MKKYIAEAIGTFLLVFFGVGSAVLAGGGIGVDNPIAITGISFAFGISVVATAVFLVVILGVTADGGENAFAGLMIGLTLVMIHLVGITITGTSVNPARSIGPALFAGPQALSQLWLFIVAPLLGGALGGFLHRARVTAS